MMLSLSHPTPPSTPLMACRQTKEVQIYASYLTADLVGLLLSEADRAEGVDAARASDGETRPAARRPEAI